MTTLSELYTYLEGKRDQKHIDSDFPWLSFPEEERSEARLEILTWWKLERIVEDEGCPIDREKALAYLDKRLAATSNQFLVYRYGYFAFLLSNNKQYAEKVIDALIECLEDLLPKEKEDYPSRSKDAIEILMTLSKKVKYHQKEAENLIWSIVDGDYGCRTKLVFLEDAKQNAFFPNAYSERLAEKCKQLLPLAPEHWNEKCCEIGLHYAIKLQAKAKTYVTCFNEALGDIEMSQLVDITSDPNNIALPHLNDSHLEKAMWFYKEAGATDKMLDAQRQYTANKKNLKYIHFGCSKETDKSVVEYFRHLNENLLYGKFSFLMWNLVFPVQYIFPSLTIIKEKMDGDENTTEQLGFSDRIKDINGNSRDAGDDYQVWQKYEVWLLNIVRNPIMELILMAVKQKKMTYAKVKTWMNRATCFGIPIEYPRNNEVATASWFSQIDYAIKALLQQYQHTLDNKPTDWRIPIEVLSIRFEGILRNIVAYQGGQTTNIGRGGNTTEALLDKLLREPCLLQVFAKEDIEFFEYVLTTKGLNIRNNVAHAFYIPQDYGITYATLVFLCVLRLAKFRPE